MGEVWSLGVLTAVWSTSLDAWLSICPQPCVMGRLCPFRFLSWTLNPGAQKAALFGMWVFREITQLN